MQRSVKPYKVGSTPTLRTMIGVIFNTTVVFIGCLVGLKLGKKIPTQLQNTLINLLGLIVIVLGVKMALGTKNFIIPMLSILVGATFGELIKLDELITNNLTKLLKKISFSNHKEIIQTFITASLLFCGGPMTIFGSIEAGLTGKNQTLIIKGILDGITAIPLAASLGKGVIFGSITIFMMQSILVVLAGLLRNFFTIFLVNEITVVGGLLLMVIGLNMMKINKEIKSINLIPSVFAVPLIVSLVSFFL